MVIWTNWSWKCRSYEGYFPYENKQADKRIQIIEALLPLVDEVMQLSIEVVRLRSEIDELKNKNSGNSSLPPSRDKHVVKKKQRSLRRKSNLKKGGQQGHKGSTLKMSTSIDHLVEYVADQCECCGEDLTDHKCELVSKKQVWDIPPVSLEVTEHRRYKTFCSHCNHWTFGEFIEELRKGPAVRYGNNLVNQLVYLSVRQLVHYQRLAEVVEILYNQPISEGTIDNMLSAKSRQCSTTYEQIIQGVAIVRLLELMKADAV